ncbi:M13 family metallopeptidase [Spiroplasma culicicola]|uniref:Endopeptidase O n=1 Tax=Spiroplasma culicicola AES-1 TaxID=1276246 RepID=W6A8N9_9MOLU|nr:M13 family metallopeptidase [Spiroplasma culicicola]AHI53255.1 endopeptidase O [Spiroplasma culicicola AES-1]
MSKTLAQDNFYDFINKEWIDNATLPAGYAAWGSFEMLRKKSIDDINNVVNQLVNAKELTSDQQKIVDVYKNYLNYTIRDQQGIEPILPLLNTIDSLNSKENFSEFLIKVNQEFNVSFFHSKGIDADFKDSNLRALAIGSMGLGMSDRDFYNNDHPRHEEIKSAYKNYIETLKKAVAIKFETNNLFDLIYNFEYEISRVMLKQEEYRNPENIYNPINLDDLNKLCPFINWTKYLTTLGYSQAKQIIAIEPKFLEKLNEMLNNISLNDLKDFMKFKVISSHTSMLSFELQKISFDYASVFSGVKEMKPLNERAIAYTDGMVGDLIAQEYIKKHFSQEAKDDVLKIVNDLIKVYSKRIHSLDWMSEVTKQKAIEKLNSFTVKIGYPDKFDDYSAIEINSYENGGSLYQNWLNISKYFTQKDLNEILLPVDKTKWYMSPQTVNAYYNPQSNEICFPAAILQEPFYDINQSKGKNLGGIGAVIGHEVSHGFDDEGSQFDKDGNYANWWTQEDHAEYSLRTKKLEEQYSEYEVDGHKVNGKLTLGENIGDLGGVCAALDICQEQCPELIQDFFENYAYVWRRKSTPEMMNTRLATDPHSPEEFRCNGVLVNIDAFHELYQTKPGDKMYKPKEDRIKIW